MSKTHPVDVIRSDEWRNLRVLFPDLDLTGADLSGLYRVEIDLSRGVLRNATLAGATLLGANLVGADLSGANLANVDLSAADLSDAVLTGATLEQVNFSRATLV
jgi:uncharacterized protein YjbI with pentapeptide repeats